MSFFRTVVGGALGFMVGGPLGAAGGAVLANALGGKDNKYKITCPHCHKSLGVDDHGRYSCCHCNNYLLFSDDGVVKDTRIDVRCPHCNCDLLIDGPGKWNCCECNKSFDYEENNSSNNANDDENTYLFIIFAAFAKFCKANGPIKKEQIAVIEDIMNNYYNLDKSDRDLAIKHFRTGKDSSTTFESYCSLLNNSCDDDLEEDRNLKNGFIVCLYKIATCSGSINYEEEKLLNFAIGILKIDPHFISSLKEEFLNNNLDKYYEILGCKKGDSLDTIKSNYRKIVNECHPDRISNKDLPEYLIKYSTERFCQVQEAYEKIKLSLGA